MESYQIEIYWQAYNHSAQDRNEGRDQFKEFQLARGTIDVSTKKLLLSKNNTEVDIIRYQGGRFNRPDRWKDHNIKFKETNREM